jgi:formiminoglutamase
MDPIDMQVWTGRVDDADGALGRRWHQVMRPLEAGAPAGTIVLLGFACDAGVARNHGRIGAAAGPTAIRTALRNMPVHECEQLADGGDIVCSGDELEAAQACLSTAVAQQLAAGRFPIALGGGHEIAYASFNGLATFIGAASNLASGLAPRIGIVNFDAHFDLRQAERGNSGTPFLQIARDCEARGWPFRYACLGVSRYANTPALFARAELLQVLWRLDETLGRIDARADLEDFIDDVDVVYLTFCLDVLPAAVAPGVSAPAARGVGLDLLEPLIDLVLASGKLQLADIAEMNPRFDIDGRTAAVAARIVARIANGASRGVTRGATRDLG